MMLKAVLPIVEILTFTSSKDTVQRLFHSYPDNSALIMTIVRTKMFDNDSPTCSAGS